MQQLDESYATTSSDVRQKTIRDTDPLTARRLCQLDRRSREICRDRLNTYDKTRICLDDAGAARECDTIPMFSRQQFLALVPKNILIYAEDPIQLTHEFYPQGYKLPNEGFAVALRKAKLMNTICAIVRPDFLVTAKAKELPIPSYIDSSLLDEITKYYTILANEALKGQDVYLEVNIKLNHINQYNYIEFTIGYDNADSDILSPDHGSVYLNHLPDSTEREFVQLVNADKFLEYVKRIKGEDFASKINYSLSFFVPGAFETEINAFRVSRFVKIAMDLGYFHNPRVTIYYGDGDKFERAL